ncbi:MAG: hypothetical protein WKF34_11850 [Pyrinomonadaceae bacterium]
MKIIARCNRLFPSVVIAFLVLSYVGAAHAQSLLGGAKAEKAKIAHKAEYKNKSFCNSNSWSSDNISLRDVREITLPASGTINVDSRQNGGIDVRGEDRGDILVRACVQTWGKTDVAARSLAESIKIATAGTIMADSSEGEKDWSVSYQILVPRSTGLLLKAHNGGISVVGIDSTAQFETMNGGLHVADVAGKVTGRTMNGGVNVVLSGSSWKGGGLDLQTVNGGVMVRMPTNYAAQVETGTVNGGYTTDIRGLEIEQPDRERGHRAAKVNVALNGGGAPVRISTTNGGVRIVQSETEM